MSALQQPARSPVRRSSRLVTHSSATPDIIDWTIPKCQHFLRSNNIPFKSEHVDAYVHQMVLWSRDRLRPQLTGWYSRRPWRSIAKGHGPIPSQLFVKVDAYVHQMVLWSRDRLRPQLTGWYSRRPWRSIAKGHGPIPSQLFVKVSLP
ncbi:UNVERIFIED_CONTAM: hypothetical protein FKN15_018356 [Acipenser sinensis]